MSGQDSGTWLQKLDNRVDIDVDWMDPDYIKSMPIKPHDQTSNQLWLHIQLSHAINKEALNDVARQLRNEGWLAIYSRMAVLLCQKNLDHIRGRVLVQTSPSEAYNTEKILEHARLYAREFQRLDIPRSRYCIKILASGPGLNAARILQQEGIPTLGTGVFSVEQAIACSQARCCYISPYYNEVRTNEDPSLWPNVEDPAIQHPFSNRILQMKEVYKHLYQVTGEEQPLLKLAAFYSIREVIAAAELGCHSVTLSPTILDELSNTNYDPSLDPGVEVLKSEIVNQNGTAAPKRLQHLLGMDSLASHNFVPAPTDVDYLANGGAELERALLKDPSGNNRLRDAIALFVRAEAASKLLIEGVLSHGAL